MLLAVATAALGTVERSLTKPIEKIIGNIKPSITQVLLRYTYDGPEDSRNRPFCAKMMQLSKTKLWSRQDIENISLRLGYSVWDSTWWLVDYARWATFTIMQARMENSNCYQEKIIL